MIRNILNELTVRGVRHLIISALFFVVYALCGTAIMLTVLFLIDRHISGESVSLISAAWILVGLLILKTISNAVADMSKHFAGFDLVERIREKIILKLKMFSLGFYTNDRCEVHHCEQTGIVGRMGGVFSVIEDCHIHVCPAGIPAGQRFQLLDFSFYKF